MRRRLTRLIIVSSVSLGFDLLEQRQILLSTFEELLSSSEALLSGHRRYPFHEVRNHHGTLSTAAPPVHRLGTHAELATP